MYSKNQNRKMYSENQNPEMYSYKVLWKYIFLSTPSFHLRSFWLFRKNIFVIFNIRLRDWVQLKLMLCSENLPNLLLHPFVP